MMEIAIYLFLCKNGQLFNILYYYHILGFIIPGEKGARPRLQLIPGKNTQLL
jgi:hypothetical protein